MPEYPKRPPFFAYKAVRLMFKSCAIMDIGELAALIVTMVAHQEDAARYRGPVRFWNREFRDTLGASENRVNRARKLAVDAGWLHYEQRNNRKVGLYWVTIPEGLENLDDTPVGEVITHADVGISEDNSTPNTHTGVGNTGGMVKGIAGDSRGDYRGNDVDTSILPLNPDPSPAPSPTTSKDVKARHTYPPEFEQWWAAYPKQRRTEKLATFKAWKKTLALVKTERFERPEQAHYWLQARVEAFAASEAGKGEYTPAPKRWLANGRYDDDPASWEGNGDKAKTPLFDVPSLPVTDGSDEI